MKKIYTKHFGQDKKYAKCYWRKLSNDNRLAWSNTHYDCILHEYVVQWSYR